MVPQKHTESEPWKLGHWGQDKWAPEWATVTTEQSKEENKIKDITFWKKGVIHWHVVIGTEYPKDKLLD